MLSDKGEIWRSQFSFNVQELTSGNTCANGTLRSSIVTCNDEHNHCKCSWHLASPDLGMCFRHLIIPSEAHVLQKEAESGLCLFACAHTCVSTVTPFPCSPGAHIAGGRICPCAFKSADFLFPMIWLLRPLSTQPANWRKKKGCTWVTGTRLKKDFWKLSNSWSKDNLATLEISYSEWFYHKKIATCLQSK